MIHTPHGPFDPDDLVRRCMRYAESLRQPGGDGGTDDDDRAAYEALEAVVRRGPARTGWALLTALLRAAPNDDLELYAAGMLEDLVVRHGAELVGDIEREAERDARFRWALGCIWLSRGELPDDVLARIVAASGGAIEPLPPLEELRAFEDERPLDDDEG